MNLLIIFLKKYILQKTISIKKKKFAENNFLISSSVALNYNMYVSALKKKNKKKMVKITQPYLVFKELFKPH